MCSDAGMESLAQGMPCCVAWSLGPFCLLTYGANGSVQTSLSPFVLRKIFLTASLCTNTNFCMRNRCSFIGCSWCEVACAKVIKNAARNLALRTMLPTIGLSVVTSGKLVSCWFPGSAPDPHLVTWFTPRSILWRPGVTLA